MADFLKMWSLCKKSDFKETINLRIHLLGCIVAPSFQETSKLTWDKREQRGEVVIARWLPGQIFTAASLHILLDTSRTLEQKAYRRYYRFIENVKFVQEVTF